MMKFDKPDWVGEHIWCDKYDAKFELEEEDGERVEYDGPVFNRDEEESLRSKFYFIQCPRCNTRIKYELIIKKGQDNDNYSR